jgi:hypothetical protein
VSKCWKQEKSIWRWLGSFSQSLLSLGASDSVRCARLALTNLLLSGLRPWCTAINHRTVRWCTGLSSEPFTGEVVALGKQLTAYGYNSPDCPVVHRTVLWANGQPGQRSAEDSARDAWPSQWSQGGTGQCPVRQRLWICNSRLRQIRKEIRTGQCPVVHRTVRCARRQKARIAFLECSQRLLAALGL